jgi:hypothetical protein
MTSSLDSSTSPGRNSTTTAQVKVMSDMIRGWSSDPVSSAIQKAHFQEESERREAEDRKKSWRIVHKSGKKWVTRDGWTGKPERAEVFTYDERRSSKLGPDSRWEAVQ